MRAKVSKILFTVIFLTGIFFYPAEAYAWEKGRLKIVPSAKYAQVWDSNIFYDRDNPKHDLITVFTPGIAGEFGFGAEDKNKVYANYEVELGAFYRYKDQNYGNHELNTGLFLDLNRITFDTNNRFRFTSDRAGTEFTDRTLRRINTYDAVLGFHYNRIAFDLGYRLHVVDYLSDTLKQLDRYHNEGRVTGYLRLASKTKALLEFVYQKIQYPEDKRRDANAFQILTGLKGNITSKIEGIIKFGYGFKDYNEKTGNDFAGLVAGIELFYDMNDRVNMSFSYKREPFESIYFGNNYYTGDHFNYRVDYYIGRNFTAILDASWFHNAYESPGFGESRKRRDNIWELSPRLEYKINEHFTVGAEYRFRQRESNLGSRRYDQHVIQTDIKLVF